MSKKITFSTIILSLILLLAVCFTPVKALHAEQIAMDYEVMDLSYSYNFELREDGYYISAYKGEEVNIELPDYYNGIPVTGIVDAPKETIGGVFYNSNILQVKLGKNIKYIGRGAFRECDKLEKFIANDCLEEVNSYAFYNCSALTELDLPKLKVMGWHALDGSGLYLEKENEEGVIDYYYQNDNNKILLRVMKIDGDSYEIEEGTHLIAQQAFYPTIPLNKLIIPTSVEYLGDFLIGGRTASDSEGYLTNFTNCEIEIKGGSLQDFTSSVNFGEASFSLVGNTSNGVGESHVTYIEKTAVLADNAISADCNIVSGTQKIAKGAFKANTKLEKITIPSSVTYIGKEAFSGCKKLTQVIIQGSVEIDQDAFLNCEKLAQVSGTITKIGQGAFSGCTSLTSIDLSSVQTVGSFAFGNCGLESLTLSDNAVISAKAFAGTNLAFNEDGLIVVGNHILGVNQDVTEVNISNKTVADHAFAMSNIEEATLSGVTLGKGAFYGCTSLETVTFDGTKIPEDCFYGAKNLETLNCSGVQEVGSRALYQAPITAFDFTQTNEVGDYAFFGTKLTSLGLGDSTKIGEYSFANSALTQITVSENNPYYATENGLLYDKDKTELVLFPAKMQTESVNISASVIGKGAVAYSQYLKTITGEFTQVEDMAFYKSSITSISSESIEKVGYKAFYGSKLTQISLPSLKEGGFKAFAYCTNLTSIALTNNQFNRTFALLKGCSNLTQIQISLNDFAQPSAKTFNLGYLFGADYFSGSTEQAQRYSDVSSINYFIPQIEKVIVTDGRVAYGAMMNLKHLKEVQLGEDVTDIGTMAFSGCEKLESILLNEQITSINANCFNGCKSLKEIDLSHVERIEEFAFAKCSDLEKITVSPKLVYIGSGAFSQNEKLTTIVVTDREFFNNFDNDTADYGLMFENAEVVIVAGQPMTLEEIQSLKEVSLGEGSGISRMEISIIILAVISLLLVASYILVRIFRAKKESDYTRPHKKHHKHHHHRSDKR